MDLIIGCSHSLLSTQLIAAAASLLLMLEMCTRMNAGNHADASHTHAAVPALKFHAGRNYELLPQVSAGKQFGVARFQFFKLLNVSRCEVCCQSFLVGFMWQFMAYSKKLYFYCFVSLCRV